MLSSQKAWINDKNSLQRNSQHLKFKSEVQRSLRKMEDCLTPKFTELQEVANKNDPKSFYNGIKKVYGSRENGTFLKGRDVSIRQVWYIASLEVAINVCFNHNPLSRFCSHFPTFWNTWNVFRANLAGIRGHVARMTDDRIPTVLIYSQHDSQWTKTAIAVE